MLVGVSLALVFAAFFASAEVALASAGKLHIGLQEEGIYSGKLLARFFRNPSNLIGATLVGRVLATVTYVALALQFIYPWLSARLGGTVLGNVWVQLPLAALVVYASYFLFVECLTKLVFLASAVRWLQVLLLPLRLLRVLLYPFVAAMAWLSRVTLRYVLHVPEADTKLVFDLKDVDTYLEQTAAPETDEEPAEVNTRILNNALSFRRLRVSECMVPRTEISAVDAADGIPALRTAFAESGHSKVLVYKDSTDNVIGYCHALEMFRKPKNIQQVLTPIKTVAETTPVADLLVEFTRERKTLALVVDEYGGTAGLISMEDIVEQLFGEIQDEYDTSEDWVEEKLDESTYLLSARHAVTYLNEKYGLNLPEGDYDTLGGLIIALNGDLPAVNDRIVSDQFAFTVLSMQETRVDVVKLKVDS
ncbi:MAG: hemolysin family protein [Cytophagales bacterium]|jgi:CBS domain containing-hemolysin-like protein|nr:hemolysin family protein [Cytophagales bacterium]